MLADVYISTLGYLRFKLADLYFALSHFFGQMTTSRLQ